MSPIRGLTLDAFGTLVELEPPAPALVRELRDGWGVELTEAEAGQALAAEIAYYKAHHLEGHDVPSLADLRLRCSGVLRNNLPDPVGKKIDPAGLLPAMLRSLRFRPFGDTVGALRRFRSAGLSLAVVSNWDVSLESVLEGCGLGDLVDCVVSSATVGAAKPSPDVFSRALELLDLPASSVLHVGDEPELDVAGAKAAGITPVVIRREPDPGPEPDPGVPAIATLDELTPLRIPRLQADRRQ